MIRAAFLVASALVAPIASAQIYKCDVGGKITYSQIPCEPKAKSKTLVAPDNTAPSSPSLAAKQIEATTYNDDLNTKLREIEEYVAQLEAEQEQRRQDWLAKNPNAAPSIRHAVQFKSVAIGMDAEALSASLGYPTDSRRSVFQNVVTEWWYYERTNGRLSVHLRNNVVDSYHQ